MGSVLQIQKRFFIPALSSVVAVVISFLVVWIFSNRLGIRSFAYGTLAGSVINYSLVKFAVHKPLFFSLQITDKHIRLLFKSSIPLLIGSIVSNFTKVFERGLASTLPGNSISYLGYANQILSVLAVMISSGIATTVYPLLSHTWSEQNFIKQKRFLLSSIRVILLMALPIAVIFIFWGTPIVQVLLERGAFTHDSTVAVSSTFKILTISFIVGALGNITAKCYYFSHKTVLISSIDILSTLFYYLLALILSKQYSYIGIAMASSISAFVTILMQFIFLHIIKINEIFISLCTISFMAFIAIIPIIVFLKFLSITATPELVPILSVIYFIGYYFVLKIFKTDEVNIVQKKVLAYLSTKVRLP
jgi:putative peptidoglycan lipid II flippase